MFREPYAAFPRPSNGTLLQKVYRYECSIIAGTASPEDINDYVECQLELAKRLPVDSTIDSATDTATDPRD